MPNCLVIRRCTYVLTVSGPLYLSSVLDILTHFLLIEIRLNRLATARKILRTTWRDTTWQHVTLIGRNMLLG